MSMILLASFGSNLSVFHEKIRTKKTFKNFFLSFFVSDFFSKKHCKSLPKNVENFDLPKNKKYVSPLKFIFDRLRSFLSPKLIEVL